MSQRRGSPPRRADATVLIGVPPFGLPAQEGVFAPDYAPEEIEEIARRLREQAGLSDEPTGVVADNGDGVVGRIRNAVS